MRACQWIKEGNWEFLREKLSEECTALLSWKCLMDKQKQWNCRVTESGKYHIIYLSLKTVLDVTGRENGWWTHDKGTV